MLPLTRRGIRSPLLACWAAALLVTACARSLDSGPALPVATDATLFRSVRVFDGEAMQPAQDVLVQGGRIARLGQRIAAPAGADIVDGAGLTLMPGLIDAHTHVFPGALEEALIFGVTTELDMFSDLRGTAPMRAAQRRGDVYDRADVFSAGTLITAPGGHGTQFGVAIPTLTSPDSADAFVRARIAEGSDWIKIVYDNGAAFRQSWTSIDRATLRAVIRAAHTHGLKAVVHVSDVESARHALMEGADGLVHMFVDKPIDDDVLRLARERNAFVIPTLVVLRGITGTGGAADLVDEQHFAPLITPQSRMMLTGSFPSRPDGEQLYAHAAEGTRRLHAAGVRILAGSDAPNPGTSHGAALHRELELLVRAGLTPVAALRAATSVPARAFGLDDRGHIATGLRADLVLVAGDPSADISATRNIRGVWKAGRAVDRAAYAAQVRAAQERAAASAADAGRARTAGEISDFESGQPIAAFGTEWFPSTDAMIGGTSTVRYAVVEGGAGGSRYALHMTGTIAGGLPNAWAGVMWSPGQQPMSPENLSAHTGLRFATRGDGRQYAVLVFSQSRGMSPIMRMFDTTADWTEVSMPWSDFGVSGSDIMAVLFVATPPTGDFDIRVDNVRLY